MPVQREFRPWPVPSCQRFALCPWQRRRGLAAKQRVIDKIEKQRQRQLPRRQQQRQPSEKEVRWLRLTWPIDRNSALT